MECSEYISWDRGIECQGVCFNYADGEIVLSVYKNLPGVARELAGTSFQRTFSRDEWDAINKYLMKTHDDVEGVFVDDFDEDEEKKELKKLEEMVPDERFTPRIRDISEQVKEAESSPLFQQIPTEGGEPLTANIAVKAVGPPKMSNAEVILPENKVPAMTKEEIKENGKEV